MLLFPLVPDCKDPPEEVDLSILVALDKQGEPTESTVFAKLTQGKLPTDAIEIQVKTPFSMAHFDSSL